MEKLINNPAGHVQEILDELDKNAIWAGKGWTANQWYGADLDLGGIDERGSSRQSIRLAETDEGYVMLYVFDGYIERYAARMSWMPIPVMAAAVAAAIKEVQAR